MTTTKKTTTIIGSPARRLTGEERERIVRMRVQGESVSEIARTMLCSREAVTHALASPHVQEMLMDCRAELRKHRAELVELWLEAARNGAKTGKHTPAMHALMSLKEVDAPVTPIIAQQAPTVIQIGLRLPGLPEPPGGGSTFTVPSTRPALPAVTQRDLTSIA